jgi:hypothetical protein
MGEKRVKAGSKTGWISAKNIGGTISFVIDLDWD